jgi:hypothetical protein
MLNPGKANFIRFHRVKGPLYRHASLQVCQILMVENVLCYAHFFFHGSLARHCVLVAASVKAFMLNPVGLFGGAMTVDDEMGDVVVRKRSEQSEAGRLAV